PPPPPQAPSIPLPSSGGVIVSAYQLAVDLYPLNILAALSYVQRVALQSIQLVSPVHIHIPTAHIGTLYGSSIGRRVTALDVFRFLRSMAASPLDLHTGFSGLSSGIKFCVKDAFYRRNAAVPLRDRRAAWRRFISGQYATDGPLGIDLLFGSSKVWGFESFSLAGCSVVHLSDPSSISAV
ncbi:hypothetical protein P691DRAFT_666770, partial [Macrolepiota fuliginosa MF-IS2]